MDFVARGREVLDIEIAGLQKVREALGDEFSRAVRLILSQVRRGHKIVVTGVGKNLHIAEKISATFASTGSTSVVLNPSQALHGDIGILNAGDVLIALSYSGESQEVLDLVPVARRTGARVIALTRAPDTSLGRLSDVAIPVAVDREACPFNMAPTASTTAALAVGDALAIVLLEARGFRREDYARLHPAGAIGRALLLRAADIMRTGERVAALGPEASVKEALLAMTQARSGSVAVVTPDRTLLGIFTDGDLRRRLPSDERLMDRRLQEVMTARPITVQDHLLAVDVLRVFEEHNIDDVLVVDAAGRLVGAIDIQDLPKLKIL